MNPTYDGSDDTLSSPATPIIISKDSAAPLVTDINLNVQNNTNNIIPMIVQSQAKNVKYIENQEKTYKNSRDKYQMITTNIKIYAIFLLQIAVAVGFVLLTRIQFLFEIFNDDTVKVTLVSISVLVVLIISMIVTFKDDLVNSSPANIIILVLYTICGSYLMQFVSLLDRQNSDSLDLELPVLFLLFTLLIDNIFKLFYNSLLYCCHGKYYLYVELVISSIISIGTLALILIFQLPNKIHCFILGAVISLGLSFYLSIRKYLKIPRNSKTVPTTTIIFLMHSYCDFLTYSFIAALVIAVVVAVVALFVLICAAAAKGGGGDCNCNNSSDCKCNNSSSCNCSGDCNDCRTRDDCCGCYCCYGECCSCDDCCCCKKKKREMEEEDIKNKEIKSEFIGNVNAGNFDANKETNVGLMIGTETGTGNLDVQITPEKMAEL